MRWTDKFNCWYVHFLRIPSVRRYLLTCLMAITIGWAYTSGGYNLVGAVLKKYENKLSAVRTQQQECATSERECRRIRLDMNDLEQEYTLSSGVCGCVHDWPLKLMNAAQSHGVSFENCTLSNEVDHAWYHQQSLQVGLVGTVSQLTKLLESVCAADTPMICESIALMRTQDNLFRANCTLQVATLRPEKTLQLRKS